MSATPARQRRTDWAVLVVGGGPAGLMCGARLAELGVEGVLVVDSGPALEERDRRRPAELLQGQGGAGLYSDGKFSFAPAGTMAYQLSATLSTAAGAAQTLTSADVYPCVAALFARWPDRQAPAYPQPTGSTSSGESGGGFQVKAYRAVYLSLDERIDMIRRLAGHANVHFAPLTTLVDWRSDDASGGSGVLATLRADGVDRVVRCRDLVLAGGRFGPLSTPWAAVEARRLEFGVRIELPASLELFGGRSGRLVDPKWTLAGDDDGVEYRTFCVCRRGETVVGSFGGVQCVSGCADGADSGVNNVGFNARVTPRHRGYEWLRQGMAALSGQHPPPFLHVTRAQLPAAATPHFGADGLAVLLRGVELLAAEFAEFASPHCRYSGPTIEGVGLYPRIDPASLQHCPHVYVAGDATGIFRGTVPALLSGAFVGEQIARRHSEGAIEPVRPTIYPRF